MRSRSLLLPVLVGVIVAGAGAGVASASTCDDACRVDGARAYVAALADHDPSEVPFHPDATRVEAGLPTGFSGDQLRADLRFGPQYRIIRAVSDETYRVRGDGVVVAEFTLSVGAGPVGLTTARVHETFRYDDGLIREIVADIRIGG
ncbi:hypothetical protein [Pseudonocardia alni]|jgi:hypothetical protein|uniref:hypothetical protein n=1 Tax=Pseudonocardia alni TaxID=33907 RepID=UPI0006CB3856|nr:MULTISPECIES: hypothetical protein [Pseudonocardia]ALE77852.1 hypothetical protein WY02_04690 [Pseudonocardia sp. AL041005-10]